MRTTQEIIERIVAEKLDKFSSWLSNTLNGDEKQFPATLLLSDGVLSNQAARFLQASPVFDTELTIDIPTAKALIKDQYRGEMEYLVHPQKFLRMYLGGDSILNSKISSLANYEYFPVILQERLLETERINDATVKRLIFDIDTLMLNYATPSCMTELLGEIYDSLRYRGSDPKLEAELLSEYFRDKRMSLVARVFDESDRRELTLHEAIDTLSSLLIRKDDAHPSTLEENTPTTYTNVDVPQYAEFVEELKEAGVQVVPYHPVFDANKQLPFEFYLSDKAKKRLKKEVFHGDEHKYVEFLATINSFTDKETAFINVDTMLDLQRVDKSSKVARRLFEAIEQRYSE